ncbi:FxSxx-COOH system tetratricopeptide repeat protein [Streptomyces griseoviridis]|uniref:Protein kinase domain-containing protein n=1 Tax=Streptomyces griseoviridis TaxID=45398 RepID=A0A918LE52_STRGD|nr:FxSxx-COOH system tetratricopeptide repeat protein [Streptomyces niveoruber]GGS35893.1 hypothetical protein GCM10010238_26760 [Streptomyces niveoruber]
MLPEPLAQALRDSGSGLGAEELLDVLWLAARLPRDATAPLARAARTALAEGTGPAAARPADPGHHDGPGRPAGDAERPGVPVHRAPERPGADRDPRPSAPPRGTGGTGTPGAGLYAAEARGARPSAPAIPLRVPEEKVLAAEELALSRALRPLKRSRPDPRVMELDEPATVTAAAETGLLDPVLRPVRTRWLDLVMLVDDGVSMLLWRRLVTEVRQLLERSGAFRTVRVHGLDTRGPRAPRVTARPYLGDDREAATAVRVGDAAAGSTLALVLSDGVGAAWWDGRMHALLGRLARQGPTAVLHTLPEPLRAGSGIRYRTWRVTTRRAGAAPHTWEIRDPVLPAELAPFTGLPVPVIEPSAPVVERWARLVGSAGTTEALPLLTAASPPSASPPARPAERPRDAGHEVLRFRAAASPEAYRLAAHVAAVAPVTVPVLRLVQKALGDGIGTGHLAEVFLGGLMLRTDEGGAAVPPDQRVFDVTEDTRRILLSTVPASELLRTSRAIGSRLGELTGRAPGFAAWLADDRGTGRAGVEGRPFAGTDERLLRRLGLSSGPGREAPDRPPGQGGTGSGDRPGSSWTALRDDDPRRLGPYTLTARSTTVHGHVVQYFGRSSPFGHALVRVPVSGDAGTDAELVRTEETVLLRLFGLGAPPPRERALGVRPWLAVGVEQRAGSREPVPDLETLLRDGWRPTREQFARIGAKLAAALAHAHGKRVVHGALTSGRVLLGEKDVVVTDWATATVDGVPSPHRAVHVPGPGLLAPELRDASASGPTEASDVYALGAVLVALLTGSVGDRPVDARRVALLTGVGARVRSAVARCLHRDPDARPSAAEVSRTLRARPGAPWPGDLRSSSTDAGSRPDVAAVRALLIGYTARDREWAEWIAWHLTARGHHVGLHLVGPEPADHRTRLAVAAADELVVVFSGAGASPWRGIAEDVARHERVVALLVDDVPARDVPEWLIRRPCTRLSGSDESAALTALLAAVDGPGAGSAPLPHPEAQPSPRAARRPPLPSAPSLPSVRNSPDRNPDFTGRETELARLRDAFRAGHRTVQVVYGPLAVGKTQLALEYAHRFAGSYDIVWWVRAEDPGETVRGLAELSLRLGAGTARDDPTGSVLALLGRLRTRDDWLIVLDGAVTAPRTERWIPDGPGHVLITTRDPDFTEHGRAVPLDVFTRAESVAFLTGRLRRLAPGDADALAAALGDHPLALRRAAGALADAVPPARYRALLADDPAGALGGGAGTDDGDSLGAVLAAAVAGLGGDHPAARDLLGLTAFLGPAPVPLDWVPGLLARGGARTGAAEAVRPLLRLGLATLDEGALRVHRLVQALVRAGTDRQPAQDRVAAFLAAVDLGRPDAPGNWPGWELLTTHLTTGHFDADRRPELRARLLEAVDYLLAREEHRAAHALVQVLRRTWPEALGPDHPDCLRLTGTAAVLLNYLGHHEEAHAAHRDTVDGRRRVLGPDHPDTIAAEYNLALALHRLGRVAQAVTVLRDLLPRSRRVSGPGHPVTARLTKALAALLNLQGHTLEARELLDRARRGQ